MDDEDRSEEKTGVPVWAMALGLIVVAINAYMLFLAVTDPPMSIPGR